MSLKKSVHLELHYIQLCAVWNASPAAWFSLGFKAHQTLSSMLL